MNVRRGISMDIIIMWIVITIANTVGLVIGLNIGMRLWYNRRGDRKDGI